MRKTFFTCLIIFFSILSYGQDSQQANWRTLTNDFMTWYTYTHHNIRLSQDFIAVDTNAANIDKLDFLNKLLAGKVFAFKTGTKDDTDIYTLYPLTAKDENIQSVIKQSAETEIQHYQMEGTAMPPFSFLDMKGNTYDNASAKGKLIVLKCWYINCVACVKEFPVLNKLVKEYKDNDHVLFISLASDNKTELTRFLQSNKFSYAVVPGMQDFMTTPLSITAYPTHLLIDETGKIVKVVNRIEDLLPFLTKAASKS